MSSGRTQGGGEVEYLVAGELDYAVKFKTKESLNIEAAPKLPSHTDTDVGS